MRRLFGERAVGVAGKGAVEIFAVLGNDEGASLPKRLYIDGRQQEQAAMEAFGRKFASELHRGGDAGVFAAVDAGGDQ